MAIDGVAKMSVEFDEHVSWLPAGCSRRGSYQWRKRFDSIRVLVLEQTTPNSFFDIARRVFHDCTKRVHSMRISDIVVLLQTAEIRLCISQGSVCTVVRRRGKKSPLFATRFLGMLFCKCHISRLISEFFKKT